jgi:hypothetical protein
MTTRKLTEEQMNCIWASTYVVTVTPNKVHFTAEFKKRFWDLLQSKKPPREIVAELGIDPEILGMSRINGLKNMISRDVRAGKGFTQVKPYSEQVKDYANPAYKIKRLEEKLAYKEQEIEFLKKIVSLGREDSGS